MSDLALYIHWPFCLSKCPYCDFNSHVRNKIVQQDWQRAYINELSLWNKEIRNRRISSVFFGGGTPSLMDPEIVATILDYLDLPDDVEITIEANPTSFEAKKFEKFKESGINRLSLGVQSLNNDDLRFLGREHSAEMALDALEQAKGIFNNYSFDLIYARPQQTISDWEKELTQALNYVGNHLSLYQLTIEKGTPFYTRFNKGEFILPDEEMKAMLYQTTQEIMNNIDMPSYEVSNHAIKGFECKHNLTYWKYGDYLGIGPGAHSRINNQEIMNIHHPENWLYNIKNNEFAIQQKSNLTNKEIISEILLMGLRLNQGISKDIFLKKISTNFHECVNLQKLDELEKEHLLEHTDQKITLTHKGRLVQNSIVEYLIS